MNEADHKKALERIWDLRERRGRHAGGRGGLETLVALADAYE